MMNIGKYLISLTYLITFLFVSVKPTKALTIFYSGEEYGKLGLHVYRYKVERTFGWHDTYRKLVLS